MHRAMYAVLGLGLAGTAMPTAIDRHGPLQESQAPIAVTAPDADVAGGEAAFPASRALQAWLARGEQRLHCLRAHRDPACQTYASRD